MQPASTEHKEDYFDTYWKERDLGKVSRRAAWRAEKLFEWVGTSYSNLLDIGAGNGELLREFMNRGYRTEGWDVSPEAVERLKERGHRAKVMDVEDDDFNGYYELVTCSETLQHLKDPAKTLSKLEQIVAPDGRIFISVPNEFHLIRRLRLVRLEQSHISLFSPRRAKDLVAVCGLQIVNKCYQPLVPPRWGKWLHKAGEFLATVLPSLFSLSTLMLVKRNDDN